MTKKSKPSPFDRALKYLSYRPRSEAEIRNYLGQDCTPELISRLKELNLVNDVDFTKWYIESRSRSRPRSAQLLALELKRKGVSMPTDDNLMPINDTQLAELALAKKKNIKSREQAISFLYRRGFSWSAIEPAIKKRYNPSHVS